MTQTHIHHSHHHNWCVYNISGDLVSLFQHSFGRSRANRMRFRVSHMSCIFLPNVIIFCVSLPFKAIIYIFRTTHHLLCVCVFLRVCVRMCVEFDLFPINGWCVISQMYAHTKFDTSNAIWIRKRKTRNKKTVRNERNVKQVIEICYICWLNVSAIQFVVVAAYFVTHKRIAVIQDV